jgi:hypothetical protein
MEQSLQCSYDFGANGSAGCLEGIRLLLQTWHAPQRPVVAVTQQLQYTLQQSPSGGIAISCTCNKQFREHDPMDTERRLDRVSVIEDVNPTRY